MKNKTLIRQWATTIVCNTFNHFMCFDTSNVAGASTCKLCGHKEPGIKWPRA